MKDKLQKFWMITMGMADPINQNMLQAILIGIIVATLIILTK